MQGRSKLIVLAVVVVAAAVAAYFALKPAPQAPAPIVAQPQAPSAAPASQSVDLRVALMKEMGGYAQTLSTAAKGGPITAEVVKAAQAISADMAKMPALFPAGSGDDKHPTTRAKADIWTKWAAFEGYAKEGQASFAALAAVAETGDADAFKAAYAKANDSCGACHKEFRGPRR